MVVLFGLLTAKYDGEAEKRVRWTVFSILARAMLEARVAGSKVKMYRFSQYVLEKT